MLGIPRGRHPPFSPTLVAPPESWQYILQGNAEIREEGKDAPCSAMVELSASCTP